MSSAAVVIGALRVKPCQAADEIAIIGSKEEHHKKTSLGVSKQMPLLK